MSNNGPWGSGGGDDEDRGRDKRGQRPDDDAQIPEIEEFMRKGSEQLRVLMGGRGGSGGKRPTSGGTGGPGFGQIAVVGALVAAGLWAYASFYTVKPEERSVELMFGQFHGTGEPGLNFAPWPVVTAEIVQVTREQVTSIGTGKATIGASNDSGLMLTGDKNIVDVDYQVVWVINDPAKYLFNLADPEETVRAVSESAMRDIIARSEMTPILTTERLTIAADLREAVQHTLDSYEAGISIVRVNFNRADPPSDVIPSFRDVEAAQQERDRLEKEADAYANKVTAEARGAAAQLTEEAQAYRARVVNQAEGDAARFNSIYAEYVKAPDVTKRRIFMENMEKVLGGVDKVVVDQDSGGGIVPYLPLDRLRNPNATQGGTN